VADADRWQAALVGSAGGHGLLGQVEGRAKAGVTGWLAAQDPAWRAAVGYVAIDMSSVFKSAATSGLLPNARLVADLFHVIWLASKMAGDVRRRLAYGRHGRRGRAGDPEYGLKDLARRGKEKLLAETVSTWRAETARAVLTGHSNAAAEGVNRLVKLVYRGAFGLANVANQQRRARYAASRSTRPNWLHTVTVNTSQPVAA
jgi:transposase